MKTWLAATVLVLAALAAALVGRHGTYLPADLFSGDLILQWRVRKVLLALLVGASMASCGLLFQTTLHNPLAEPFTLGTSSGAALGAIIALVVIGTGGGAPLWGLSLAAFAGAMVVSLPLYMLAVRRRVAPEAVVLAGVAISFAVAAIISGIAYISSESTLFAYVRWTQGNIDILDYSSLALVAVPALLPVVLCWGFRYRLDAMLSGEEFALARGVSVARIRSLSVLAVAMAVGATVAACGPIGFIGLIVPHAARILTGATHRSLSVIVPILGALTLVVCDFIANNMLETLTVPVGVITAGLGTPVFLMLLLARFRRR